MSKVEFATSEDADQLGRLFHEDMTDQGISLPLASIIAMVYQAIERTHQPEPKTILWVVRDADKHVVGALLVNMAMSLKFAGPSIWIEELYVSPRARRQGIGKLLIDHLLHFAEIENIKGIDLEAYQGNTPASILYRSLGFKRLGRERFYYKFGESEYL